MWPRREKFTLKRFLNGPGFNIIHYTFNEEQHVVWKLYFFLVFLFFSVTVQCFLFCIYLLLLLFIFFFFFFTPVGPWSYNNNKELELFKHLQDKEIKSRTVNITPHLPPSTHLTLTFTPQEWYLHLFLFLPSKLHHSNNNSKLKMACLHHRILLLLSQ